MPLCLQRQLRPGSHCPRPNSLKAPKSSHGIQEAMLPASLFLEAKHNKKISNTVKGGKGELLASFHFHRQAQEGI